MDAKELTQWPDATASEEALVPIYTEDEGAGKTTLRAIKNVLATDITGAINAKIETLDAGKVGGESKYIKSISENDGIINAEAGDVVNEPVEGSDDLVTAGALYDYKKATDETIEEIQEAIEEFATDNELSTTSERPVQNKIITANLGTVLNTQSQTTAKTVTINGVNSLFDGLTIKVCFKNGHSGSSFTLNLNSLGVKTIYVNKNGSAVAMASHAINSVNWFVQKYTTLELIYDTSLNGWLVLGNPEVLSNSNETSGYKIKANGFITQWRRGLTVTANVSNKQETFQVPFINTPSIMNNYYLNQQYNDSTAAAEINSITVRVGSFNRPSNTGFYYNRLTTGWVYGYFAEGF